MLAETMARICDSVVDIPRNAQVGELWPHDMHQEWPSFDSPCWVWWGRHCSTSVNIQPVDFSWHDLANIEDVTLCFHTDLPQVGDTVMLQSRGGCAVS